MLNLKDSWMARNFVVIIDNRQKYKYPKSSSIFLDEVIYGNGTKAEGTLVGVFRKITDTPHGKCFAFGFISVAPIFLSRFPQPFRCQRERSKMEHTPFDGT